VECEKSAGWRVGRVAAMAFLTIFQLTPFPRFPVPVGIDDITGLAKGTLTRSVLHAERYLVRMIMVTLCVSRFG
jgi:hypothetical protein